MKRDGRARCGFNGREIGRVTCASHFKEKDSQSFSNALISNRARGFETFESRDTDIERTYFNYSFRQKFNFIYQRELNSKGVIRDKIGKLNNFV